MPKKKAAAKSRKSRKNYIHPKAAAAPLASVSSHKIGDIMTLTELQFVARSMGIPFGGLTKSDLIKKIKKYR